MKILGGVLGIMLVTSAQIVSACSIVFDERSPRQIRAQSRPVAVDRECRVINGGVYDGLTLGRAEDLGYGRFQQVVGDRNNAKVYVADCNTREATLLLGTATQTGETSCGPTYEFADLAGPDAIMSLSQGANLHELVEIAAPLGVKELNPLIEFFQFDILNGSKERYDVGSKDRFDLMCGCKRLYPESLGASQ